MERVNSKVLILGEYSVLYNGMALTIPFNRFFGELSYPKSKAEKAFAMISNKGIREFCRYILNNYTDETFKLNVEELSKELDKGLFFKSNIPQGFGLGSSGALVAAIFLRYLDKAGDIKDELKKATKNHVQNLRGSLGALESHFHGMSSGIDPLSIIYNEPILLNANKEIIEASIPTQNLNGKNRIFLLNTHINRNSSNTIEQVNKACQNVAFKEKMNSKLTGFTNASIESFLSNRIDEFYLNLEKLVEFQRNEMSFLIPEKYQSIVDNGLESKDYYLKICGSGGGGYMIGFTDDWKATQEQLKNEDLETLYQF